MNIGYFICPTQTQVLVVIDFENWTSKIVQSGFPQTPVVTRIATTPETVALQEHSGFPGWLYHNMDELIDDEIRSGAAHYHLSTLLEATASRKNPLTETANIDAA